MGAHKTDPHLLEALQQAAKRKMTADDLRQQKVSFIMGSLRKDSSISREYVEAELDRLAGNAD